MDSHPAALTIEYASYRSEVEGRPLADATRKTALAVICLSTSFVVNDAISYPDLFWTLFAIRMALNVVLFGIYLWTAHRHPLRSAIVGCLAIGTGLIAVIEPAGGLVGEYYVGLVLLFVGMPVFMPYTPRQAALLVGVLLLTFAALPLLDPPVPWPTYFQHLFFPTAAAVMCVWSCSVLEAHRFRDFLQRREIEEARDHLKALDLEKSRFTANVHHELRTPLTLMLAPIDALLGGDFGQVADNQRAYLHTMRNNGLRLLKLINNLLDLAKLEGRQLRITRRPVLLQKLIHDLVASSSPLAEQKGLAITTESISHLPPVNVDADAMDKVLVNLIGNALKFTDAPGTIRVVGSEIADGLRISVSDTGLGLSPDQLTMVFDRFAQADSSTTRRHEGTGIGLSLAKELVELHGGRIWAESPGEGDGSTFHFEIPFGVPDELAEEEMLLASELGDAMDKSTYQGSSRVPHPHSLRDSFLARSAGNRSAASDSIQPEYAPDAQTVLICEDNPDMRRLLADLLAPEFRIRVAQNGRHGLEEIRREAPDLVLTDVMMPEMSGTELCTALKADPETQGIPVMLVTSKAERELKLEALELGADDYVTKPFHPRELQARVRSLVRVVGLRKALSDRNSELENALNQLQEAGVQLARSERLAAVGELAAGIAHEVNNPMNFATNALRTLSSYVADVECVAERATRVSTDPNDAGFADFAALLDELEFSQTAESLRELLKIVADGLGRTQGLVSDLKDFAAPGRKERQPVDVSRAVEATAHLLSYAMRERGVELTMELPADLPRAHGSQSELGQVFLNLLKNAMDAAPRKDGKIRVRAAFDGETIEIRVDDNGPGIPDDARTRIFDPFFTTKEAGVGTGLGLSISRRIIEEHGGWIRAESLDRGTRFSVGLPATPPET